MTTDSRICVKNLTNTCTENSIKAFFAKNGKVTDCRLLKKPNGDSRRVAFVGFMKASDAEYAIDQLNGSKIGLSKIRIEKCKQLNENPSKIIKKSDPKKQFLKDKIDPDLVDSDEENEVEEVVEDVSESGRLFIRNLSYLVTETELKSLLSDYGTLTELLLPMDDITNRPKGFAFVEYQMPENAVKVLSELDGTSFMGRLLHVIPGKEKLISRSAEFTPKHDPTLNTSYKKEKMAKMKEKAGEKADTVSWNSLFVGTNAVADEMAKRYGLEKDKIMRRDDVAVQLALGESQIVSDIRSYLLDNGVKLEVFTKNAKRSDKIILVKNLPSGALPTELRSRFETYGGLGRIIMPPSGLAALVEFAGSINAKKAFKGVAYSRFGDRPLYLEWAPVDCLEEENVTQKRVRKELSEVSKDDTSGTMLFVKNLNFETTDESLRALFAPIGPIIESTVSKRLERGKYLSMGYGWCRMAHKQAAQEAIKKLQGYELDGHRINIKISQNRDAISDAARVEPQKQDQAKGSAKLMVRNVPFQCQVAELESLFSTFGDLKFCRMPKLPSGRHRGFAFVEFSTAGDAKAAFEALKLSTHMYGRRLVLEWADTDAETVSSIRSKTKLNYNAGAWN